MATVGLYITLEPEYGEPITIARVRKRDLLIETASEALLQAEQLAERMAVEDVLLGEIAARRGRPAKASSRTRLAGIAGAGSGSMKVRSAPIDDIHLEALLVLDAYGRWPAPSVRRLVNWLYKIHSRLLVALVWLFEGHRRPIAPLGYEPFNLAPEELDREWEQADVIAGRIPGGERVTPTTRVEGWERSW